MRRVLYHILIEWWSLARIQRRMLLFVAPMLLAGCTYLHNSGRMELAEQAQAEFAAIVKNPPYAAETARFVSHTARVEMISRDLHVLNDTVQLNTLASRKWTDLEDLTKTARDEAAFALKLAKENRETAKKELKEDLEKLPGVKKNVANLQAAITAAADAALRFEATQILLRTSLGVLLDGKENASLETLRSVLDQPLPGADKEKTVAKVLKLQPRLLKRLDELATKKNLEPKDLEIVNLIIGLGSSLPDIHKSLNFEAPGITAIVLGLSLDVARAEELRLKTEVSFANRVLNHHDQHIEILEKYIKDLDEELDPNKRGIAHLEALATNAGDVTVRDTLTRLAMVGQKAKNAFLFAATPQEERDAQQKLKDANDELLIAATPQEERDAQQKLKDARDAQQKLKDAVRDAQQKLKVARGELRAAYIILGANFELRVLDGHETDLFKDRTATLKAERQLRITMVDLNEREALLARGLAGLVEFHRGGITAEDINDLLQLGQAIGIAVLAGQV